MKLRRFLGLLFATFTLFFVNSNCLGESPRDVHDDPIRPNAEEFTGNLDSIKLHDVDSGKTTLVINDTSFIVDQNTVFRSQGGALTTLAYFEPGMTVKFFAIDSLLTKMWTVTAPQSMGSQTESDGSNSDNSLKKSKTEQKIRKENGVWKN